MKGHWDEKRKVRKIDSGVFCEKKKSEIKIDKWKKKQ